MFADPPKAFLTSPPTPTRESLLILCKLLSLSPLSCDKLFICSLLPSPRGGTMPCGWDMCWGRSLSLSRSRSRSLSFCPRGGMELTMVGLVQDGIPMGVWGALLGLAWDVGTAPGGNGGDFVLRGDELGVLLGEDWWF